MPISDKTQPNFGKHFTLFATQSFHLIKRATSFTFHSFPFVFSSENVVHSDFDGPNRGRLSTPCMQACGVHATFICSFIFLLLFQRQKVFFLAFIHVMIALIRLTLFSQRITAFLPMYVGKSWKPELRLQACICHTFRYLCKHTFAGQHVSGLFA